MSKAIGLSLFLSLGVVVVAPVVHASPLVFDYTGSTPNSQGTLGNSIVETVSGETVTATAWGITGNSDTTFQTAALGQYIGLGLGVCNQNTVPCYAPNHEVNDNEGDDFVLFTFSTPVTSVTITIDPVCDCNTNASYYVGNGLNPAGDTLASLGTVTNSNETTPDVTRTVTLTGLGSGVTSILFGASISGTDNYFKIASLSATEASAAPEPATFGLAGVALIALGVIRRKSRNNGTR